TQYALAQLIEKSDDSSASRSEARRWYEQSAAQGHRLAAAKLEQWGKSSGAADLQISRAGVFDAIQHNDAALIDTLVSKGYDLNLSDSQGNTTVMAALLAGWPRLARTLIANSSQLDQANSQGTRPLHMASTRNYQGIVRILLNANVGVDEPDSRGETALMLAVKNENIEIARMLLDKGAKYDLINNKQKSAVDFAYAGDNPKGRALFASYGIKPRAVVKTQTIVSLDEFKAKVKRQGARYAGWPSLNIAIELGESSISSQIIAQKPDLGATDPDGNSALHVAARKGDAGMLRRLVAAGARVDATNLRKETALYLAVESACLNCVALLLDNNADQSIATRLEVTPLEVAVLKQRSKIAALLVKTSSSHAGIHRVLLLAVQKKMENLAVKLAKRDSQLGSMDNRRRTVLWYAAAGGLEKTTAYIIGSGKIDVNLKDINGHSALAGAVVNGHFGVARLLIDKGADLSLQTTEGNTVLMLAVLAKNPQLVEFLLTRDINIDAQNGVGDTALMMAAASAQNPVIEMLISAGADMQLRNKEDLNAYQIATNSGHEGTAKYILEKSNFVFKLFN
ncbi:MAG: ankyrin repeat domain-containing protein, partial [Gammaproteobacteria bacterium]|nr:ankyrin repeat domain-containing protein [Gammaproteobacteria bacterium]